MLGKRPRSARWTHGTCHRAPIPYRELPWPANFGNGSGLGSDSGENLGLVAEKWPSASQQHNPQPHLRVQKEKENQHCHLFGMNLTAIASRRWNSIATHTELENIRPPARHYLDASDTRPEGRRNTSYPAHRRWGCFGDERGLHGEVTTTH